MNYVLPIFGLAFLVVLAFLVYFFYPRLSSLFTTDKAKLEANAQAELAILQANASNELYKAKGTVIGAVQADVALTKANAIAEVNKL